MPPGTRSGKRAPYCLVFEGRHYLPRAVARWVNILSDDYKHAPNSSRDRETYEWLLAHGFEVIKCRYKPHACDGLAWNPEEYHEGEIYIDAPYPPITTDDPIPNYGHGETIIETSLPLGWEGKTNVILGGVDGTCHNILVVGIGFNDSISERLLQAVQHVRVYCPQTKMVMFLAMKWDYSEWNFYQHIFKKFTNKCELRLPFRAGIDLT